MKFRLLLLAFALGMGIATAACEISTATLENALELPTVTPAVKTTFQSTVSTVTEQVLTAALASVEDVTAVTPAPITLTKQSLQRLATQAGQTITVNNTVTKEDGGTITVTGTITSSGTQTSGSIDLNLKAEWTNLGASDGTTTQKSSGSETIIGTMSWTESTSAANLTVTGSFTLATDNFTFDITMTLDGDKMVYSGSVNGQVVAGDFAAGSTSPKPAAANLACTGTGTASECSVPEGGGAETCNEYSYDYCLEFTDPAWTEAGIDSTCSGKQGTRVATCSSAGRLGRCTNVHNSLVYVYHSYSQWDQTQTDCVDGGGTWQAN